MTEKAGKDDDGFIEGYVDDISSIVQVHRPRGILHINISPRTKYFQPLSPPPSLHKSGDDQTNLDSHSYGQAIDFILHCPYLKPTRASPYQIECVFPLPSSVFANALHLGLGLDPFYPFSRWNSISSGL